MHMSRKKEEIMKKVFFAILILLNISSYGYPEAGSWKDITRGLNDKAFYSIAYDKDHIYVGTSSGLYRQSRNNPEWEQIFMCRGQNKGVNHIFVAEGKKIYIATSNGFFGSFDFGKTWKKLFRGIGPENFTTYVVLEKKDGKTIYLGTLKGLYRSKDSADTWEKPLGVLGDSKVSSIAKIEDMLFVICDNELYEIQSDFKSYNKIFNGESLKGFNWADTYDDNPDIGPIFTLNNVTASKKDVYLSTNRGIFTSSDLGQTWSKFNDSGLLSREVNYAVAIQGVSSDIFAATKEGVFGYRNDLWNRIYSGMESQDARWILVADHGKILALCKNRIYSMYLDSLPIERGSGAPKDILARFKNEPSINETLNMAIVYAEVYPGKIEKWRKGARFKALLPKVNLGFDNSASDTYEIYTSMSNQYWMYGPRDKTEGWDLSLTWDLGDLVWNESQTSIDVRSKLMVQLRDDIVDEVTRAYFERRRLQVDTILDPPKDVKLRLKRNLRIQELTANLDGLTGGNFSENIEQNEGC